MDYKVYKLQWTYVNDETGNPIPATEYKYQDFNTDGNHVAVYYSKEAANRDRMILLSLYNDRYFRVCEY